MKFMSIDGPVMRFLGKVADMMILNLLVLFCSIPIITMGAALTAMHYVALKVVRNEESYITKDFFKSFKMNFKQWPACSLPDSGGQSFEKICRGS